MNAAVRALVAVVLLAAPACSDASGADSRHRVRASPTDAAPPTARQTPEPPCRDTTPGQRGESALRTLPTAWRASGASVAFEPGREGMLGETTIKGPIRVMIYVRPCADQSDDLLRHVIAHELGHAWDRHRMTPELRAEYMKMRGIPASTPWIGCAGCEDFATPAGDFAETYAQWLRGSGDSRSELAPAATPQQLERIAARFFR